MAAGDKVTVDPSCAVKDVGQAPIELIDVDNVETHRLPANSILEPLLALHAEALILLGGVDAEQPNFQVARAEAVAVGY